MSYFDLENNKCDHCGAVYNPGDGYTNDKAGEPGYSEFEDVCGKCGHELHLSNCAECGGMLPDAQIDQRHYLCPACASVAKREADQGLMDARAENGECPRCGTDANWLELEQEDSNVVKVGSCSDCGARFHIVFAYSTVIIDEKGKEF